MGGEGCLDQATAGFGRSRCRGSPTPPPPRSNALPQKKSSPSIVLGRLQQREKWVSPGLGNSLKHRIAIAWNGLKAAC